MSLVKDASVKNIIVHEKLINSDIGLKFFGSLNHPTEKIYREEANLIIRASLTQKDTFPWNSGDSIRFDYFLEGDSVTIPIALFKRAREKYPRFREDIIAPLERVFACDCQDSMDDYDNELVSYQGVLYTFLMRRKNTSPQHWESRIKLLSLFQNINFIYQKMANDGTGFMHKYEEIPSMVENCVDEFEYFDSDDLKEVPDFKEEKRYYIKMITATVRAREKMDFVLEDDEKKEAYKLIYETIKNLDQGIINKAYLDAVRNYQYSNYRSGYQM